MRALQNSKCTVEYREDQKEIFGRDLTDHYNDPAFYTKSKRGIKKAWQAIETRWTDSTSMHDLLQICQEFGIRSHYWYMVD